MLFSSKSEYFDVVVIGCGPAGSVLSANLAKEGLSVLSLERHLFPRYHIGESLTGLVGDYIRELGLGDEMKRLGFPQKLGVQLIGRESRHEFFVPAESPTWHVRRAEFDEMLLNHAIKQGVTHRFGSVKKIFRDKTKIIGVGYKPYGSSTDLLNHVRCKIIADASGHSTILSKYRVAGRRSADSFRRKVVVFSQFRGALRDQGELANTTVIFQGESDQWAWFIPISDDVVSVGVVLATAVAEKHGDTVEELFKWGTENIHSDFTRRLQNATMTEPVRMITNFSYKVEPFAGDGWICVGDSHRFIDPILPLGVTIAISEAKAASHAIVKAVRSGDCTAPFAEYVEYSKLGQNAASDLISYYWHFLSMLSRQTRGKLRKDIIRLMDGDLFSSQEITALTAMRNSIDSLLPSDIPAGSVRDIARRVRFSYLEGIEAAYISAKSDQIKLWLFLSDVALDLEEALGDFEESLQADFGRQNLNIIRYTPDQKNPELDDDAKLIFDNRRSR